METLAAESWPYILKPCEPKPSVAYMHCMRTYLSLKVYINSLVPNPRGPNSSESLRNFQECLELDTPGPSAASFLVSLLTPELPLASGCLRGFLYVSQDTHCRYVCGLVMTYKSDIVCPLIITPWLSGHGRVVALVCLIWTALHRMPLTIKEGWKR